MKRHIGMHIGLLVVIVAVFGLSASGVAIPSPVIYLVVLACPLTMILMMRGMNHDHAPVRGDEHTTGASAGQNVDHPADSSK